MLWGGERFLAWHSINKLSSNSHLVRAFLQRYEPHCLFITRHYKCLISNLPWLMEHSVKNSSCIWYHMIEYNLAFVEWQVNTTTQIFLWNGHCQVTPPYLRDALKNLACGILMIFWDHKCHELSSFFPIFWCLVTGFLFLLRFLPTLRIKPWRLFSDMKWYDNELAREQNQGLVTVCVCLPAHPGYI